MPKIQIITSPGTAKAGRALADAIQQAMGVEVGVTHPPDPRLTEKLGQLLDTLAVLRETDATLRVEAEALMERHPELVGGSHYLTLDERITHTVSNRHVIRDTYGDQRPVHPPEQMIRAGVEAALGGEAPHLGALVYLASQHASMTEASLQAQLKAPWRSTIALGEQIQRRIDHPTVRNIPAPEPSWDASKMEFAPVDPEELDQYRADAYEDQRGGYEPGED